MTQSAQQNNGTDAPALFADGGESGNLIRSMDWSETPLGPIESWPQCLRTALSICLASDLPICIIWGTQHIQLYNDRYRSLYGSKHPQTMGGDFKQSWSSSWPAIGAAFERARAGETASVDNLRVFLDRHGYPEETYLNLSFSPIRDESGHIAGLFHPLTEVTQQRFDTYAEAVPAIVWVCRTDGFALYFNRRWVEYTGQTADEYRGYGWADTLHPRDRSRILTGWEHCTRTGEVFEGEVRYRRHDGEYHWHYFRGVPVRAEDDTISAWYGTSIDINSHKQAEGALRENERRLRLAQRAGRVGVFEWLIPQNRVIWSPELETLYGLPEGTFEGNFDDWRKRVVSEDGERIFRDVGVYLQERRTDYSYEFRVIMPDGSYRWLSGQAQFFFDDQNQPLRMIGVNVDIDERKRAEEALLEADRRKNEFLATLAHELRNPLAPLRSGLEVLKLSDGNAEATGPAHAMMERQLQQMVRLIDDLLDVSRISRGQIELRREQVTLQQIVQNAVETTETLIRQAEHEFLIGLPDDAIWVDADTTRLGQVFANLLNNAAKFTDPPGRIELSVGQSDDEVIVTVRDNGIGIPAGELSGIFDLFTQVDRSLEKARGGLGIGLSLVRSLVGMHGGSIEAKSAGYGRGSEFIVRLPLAQPVVAGRNDEDAPAINGASGSQRVLVVDDNRDAADSLAMILQIMGNDTRTAYDGLEALEVAQTFRPGVVLLDIGMPKLNGYETARRLRNQPWGRHIVLVALTGWGQDEDRRQSREAGFNLHMVKPIEPAAIRELLAQLA